MKQDAPSLVAALRRSVYGLALVGIGVTWSSLAVSQELIDEPSQDDTPEVVPQQESVTIEAYTGPPIFLPQPAEPPPATQVEDKEVTDYYDNETKEKPRVIRSARRYSDNSVKNHGPYEEFYQSGQTFSKGRYDEGVPVGEWTYYHPDGTVAKTVTYVDGRPDGAVEVHRADGSLRAKREYADGKRTGAWTVYGEDGSQKLLESLYSDGQAEGVWQVWYPDGQQRRQVPFADGKQHGTVVEWNKEGDKVAEITYVNGVRDGTSRVWTGDGRQYEQEYKEGRLISTKEVEN